MDLTHLTTLTPVSFLWERLLQKIADRQAYTRRSADLFTLIKVKINLLINMFLHHPIKKNPITI